MQTQDDDFICAEFIGEEAPDGYELWRVDAEGVQWFRRIASKTKLTQNGGEYPTIYGVTPEAEGWFGRITGWLWGKQ